MSLFMSEKTIIRHRQFSMINTDRTSRRPLEAKVGTMKTRSVVLACLEPNALPTERAEFGSDGRGASRLAIGEAAG